MFPYRNITNIARRNLHTNIRIPNQTCIQLKGKDCKKLLQGLITNDMMKLESNIEKDNNGMYAAFLNTKGRIISEVQIFDTTNLTTTNEEIQKTTLKEKVEEGVDTTLSLMTNNRDKDPLMRHLKVYKLRSKVKLSEVHDRHLQLIGETSTEGDSIEYTRRLEMMRMETSLSREENDHDHRIYRVYRYMNGLWSDPREIEGKIPLECNMDILNYISFTKGCYIGQELIARTKYKGTNVHT